jgi:hypothetical protein
MYFVDVTINLLSPSFGSHTVSMAWRVVFSDFNIFLRDFCQCRRCCGTLVLSGWYWGDSAKNLWMSCQITGVHSHPTIFVQQNLRHVLRSHNEDP